MFQNPPKQGNSAARRTRKAAGLTQTAGPPGGSYSSKFGKDRSNLMTKRFLVVVCLLLLSVSAFAADGRYLVGFKSGVPSGFVNAVNAAGGQVVFEHRILAIVSGLDDASAASLGKLNGVSEVQA